jgi:predicted transcriptional regulator YdeE
MKPRIVKQKEFSVIGIEARTNNAKEATSEAVIGSQWQKFFKDGVLDKIPNKVDSNMFAVYSAYASDRNGDYDHLIGAKVSDASIVPPGMVLKKIPSGKYACVTSDTGPVGKVVVEAWQEIWSLEDTAQLGGPRAYKSDFEVYDHRSRDPQNSQVDICVGIK